MNPHWAPDLQATSGDGSSPGACFLHDLFSSLNARGQFGCPSYPLSVLLQALQSLLCHRWGDNVVDAIFAAYDAHSVDR